MFGFGKSDEQNWDEEICNLRANSWFGRGREAHEMANRMEQCPNNPANGGDGYDHGDGKWTDAYYWLDQCYECIPETFEPVS